ncbi:hypothetical protein [Clostridium thermobutyricum]|uniref:Uncharacterized protein n=1 Tax=Clostridium thermobutyricum DSM 4928 TaxID=1121339 RepID=A0A1V4SYF0_9CLOT|nr:hypothetical protein [Clostridium thermobutyricum]OPX49158.1 hypothetical protein CLTHE_09120 [Clostridium thermobutyricum DSM 4928]
MNNGKEIFLALIIYTIKEFLLGIYIFLLKSSFLIIGLILFIILFIIYKLVKNKEKRKYYIDLMLFCIIPGLVLYIATYILNCRIISIDQYSICTKYIFLGVLASFIFPIYCLLFVVIYTIVFKYRRKKGLADSLIKNRLSRYILKGAVFVIIIGGTIVIAYNSILSVGPNKADLVKKVESIFNSNGEKITNLNVEEINTFNELQSFNNTNEKKFWFVGKIDNIHVNGNITYKRIGDKWVFYKFLNSKVNDYGEIPNIYIAKESLVGENVLGVTIKNANDIKITNGFVNFNTGNAEYWVSYNDDKNKLEEEISFKNINNSWKLSKIGFVENENTLKFYNEM